MEYVLLAMVLAFIGYYLHKGYAEATRPPPTLRDGGGGIMEPVCGKCHARLVTVTRKQGGGLAAVIAMVLGLFGLAALLANWIAGLAVILLAAIVHHLGKPSVTILTCPACGQDDRILR